ncbi:MAG: hypothetical protein MUF31_04690 [Akkermansiaceae bacterium]|jgi:hypothetical protein|nr:hypothetical protein [Akkermansiaceae bacterium]
MKDLSTPRFACRLSILLMPFIGVLSALRGEEILFHAGPPVETPAATQYTPFQERDSPKLIKFQREFFIDREVLASLPMASADHENTALSAIKAIQLAEKDVDPDGVLRSLKVKEVKLLKASMIENRPVDYYMISMLSNGSEEHRIVLMNGDVISSRLREIKD